MPSYPGVGDRIGRFRVLAQLGAGGMGVVYDALEENLDRRVALKVIAPVFAEDEDFRERFGREARALASLDSAHVVQVYAHGEEDGYLYIATQLIPDGDLGQMVARWGPAPIGRAVALIEDVAVGLADAHAAGLVHRDIKPANVLVRRRGSGASASVSAYLGDFGIARKIDAEATRVGSAAAGTPSYMAPELHHGAPASPASDLYSLGCLLWVTLTGAPPYAGTTEFAVISAHLEAPVPQLAGSSPLVDAVNHVLRRSMAKSPAERYRQAGELRDDLRRAGALTNDPLVHAQARRVDAVPPAPASLSPASPATLPPAPYAAPFATPYAAPAQALSAPSRPPVAATGPAGPPVRPRTSRRTGLWVGLAVAAAVVVGGGVTAVVLSSGSDGDTAAPPPAPTSELPSEPASSSTPPPAAFADQPAQDILSAAQRAMAGLDSVRISGDVLDGGDLLGVDLTITSNGDCDGTISSGGGSAQLRRIGGDTWFLADEAFWIASTDATQGPLIAATVDGRWVSVPAADAKEFATVCDLDGLLSSTSGPGAGEVLGPDTVEGQDVVRVDTGDDVSGGGANVAAVAVDDPHYILELDGDADGAFTFSDFDQPFAAQPPSARDVFDLPSFG